MPKDDSWKDELLDRHFISGLDFRLLPVEQQDWIKSNPHVFYCLTISDGIHNLLHYENKELLSELKSREKL